MKLRCLPLIRETLSPLIPHTVQVKTLSQTQIQLDFEQLSRLKWKKQPASLDPFEEILAAIPECQREGSRLTLPSRLELSQLMTLYEKTLELGELICKENLDDLAIWGQIQRINPTGIGAGVEGGDSLAQLEELYQKDYIVKEKKELILDLERSLSSFLVSTADKKGKRQTLLDGASQIASLALGFNDPQKKCMGLRPEINDPEFNQNQLDAWDVTEAFVSLLRNKTSFPNIYLVNSGAEAVETALRSCQIRYPDRKKILSFEGSFHGRTLLALHCTHSPAKRQAFEIFPGLVTFAPFPETKSVNENPTEPEGWLDLWKDTKNKDFQKKLEKISQTHQTDPVLASEIQSLSFIRKTLSQESHLAVILEPMQCEGGDRFGTNRFFRALRVLTRAFDTPLVLDEVQTGFGLGKSFFWYQDLNLPEPPDAVCSAKKAQVGVCLTRFSQDHRMELSAASIYRGYLHALAEEMFDPEALASKVLNFLQLLQTAIGSETLIAPRNEGLCFAFDLPSPEILTALVKHRFKNGILFYPAGDRTARFRLLYTTTPRELSQLFLGIYRCFLDLSEQELIGKIPTLEEWLPTLPPVVAEIAAEKKGEDWELPWKKTDSFPRDRASYLKIKPEDWNQIFRTLVQEVPQLIRSPVTLETDLQSLQNSRPEDLWEHYQSSNDFTLLDLYWQSSRAFGHSIHRLSSEEIGKIADEIRELESAVYEPERQDQPEMFEAVTKDPKAVFLSCRSNEKGKKLLGIASAAPLSQFKNIELVDTDPRINDDRALYSVDVTVHPEMQGQGLGLRFKVEQYIEALRQGTTVVRSRNRHPEAEKMARLNQSLGAVIINRNDHDYGGDGVALYQSLDLGSSSDFFRVKDPSLPIVRNKSTLSNFISSHTVNHLEFFRDLLPPSTKHLYLASGRSECVDKLVKMARFHRPNASIALSFKGDYFGSKTAAARSLGDQSGPRYFEWPLLDPSAPLADIQAEITEFESDQVLGLFVEPISEVTGEKKTREFLVGLIEACHQQSIPVIFHETASHFFKYRNEDFFAASTDIQPDGIYFYPGGQLGMIAVSSKLFVDKPLQMISTWDGDDQSLNLFKSRLLGK